MINTNSLERAELEYKYLKEEKSISQIAKECNCSRNKIHFWLKRYNIPRRKCGSFKKGHTPWSKGLNHKTDERILSGKNHPMFGRTGELNPMFGKENKWGHHTEEHKRYMGSINKGQVPWSKNLTKETDERLLKQSEKVKGHIVTKKTREKIRNGHLGKKASEETLQKLRKARAKQILPIKDTTIEVKIQEFLKQLNIDFFTHQYMKIEHGYQCDILIPSMNLVIECDGDYWHKYPVGNDIDHIRTSELIKKGFKVLRLWEREIRLLDIDEFKERLDGGRK